MAHTSVTTPVAGTNLPEYITFAREILIKNPLIGKPSAVFYFESSNINTFTPADGGDPVVTVTSSQSLQAVEIPYSELVKIPEFQTIYNTIKALADTTAVKTFPELTSGTQTN